MSHQNRSLHDIRNNDPGEPICRECQHYVQGNCSIHGPFLVPNIKKEDNLQSDLPQWQFLVKDEAEGCSSDTAFQNDSVSINPIADAGEVSEKNLQSDLPQWQFLVKDEAEGCSSDTAFQNDSVSINPIADAGEVSEKNLQSDLPQWQFLVKDEAEGCSSDTAFQNDSVSINPIADAGEVSEKNPELTNFLGILEQCTSSLNVTEDVILFDGNGDFELSELVLNSENSAEKDSYIKRIQAQLDEEIMRDIEAEAKMFEAIQISNTFRENLCKNQSEELVKNYPHTSTSTQIAQNEETNGISINSKRKCLTAKKSITTKRSKFQNTNEDALETDLESETNIKKNTFVIRKQNFQEPIFKKIVDLNSKRTSKERKTYTVPNKQKIKTSNKYKYMEKGNIKGVQKPVLNTNFAKFQCNECGKEFSTKDILTDHILQCTKPKSLVNDSQLKKADASNSLLSEVYNCDICTFKTNQKRSIETHLKMHSVSKRLSCDICEYRCTYKSTLVIHIRTHTGEKPFTCNICEYRYSQKSTLNNHMKTHTGEKPFCCNICEYRCSQKSHLNKHMKTHTGEKPFTCDICEYRCACKSTLVKHIRTHTGEKPFCCNICKYRCSQKINLIGHIRTHTGEKPFCCNICEYRCSQKSHLNKHMKTHTGEKPFTCDICEYRCACKSTLVKHIRTHTGEKPYCCNICEYRCSQKGRLNKHVKTHR